MQKVVAFVEKCQIFTQRFIALVLCLTAIYRSSLVLALRVSSKPEYTQVRGGSGSMYPILTLSVFFGFLNEPLVKSIETTTKFRCCYPTDLPLAKT